MYPSNGYLNSTTTFPDDFNPTSELQDLSSSSSCLFHFPSPLNQYEDEAIYLQHLHAILSQNDLDNNGAKNEMTVPENTANSNADVKEHMCAGRSTDMPVEKKKMSKKDRHSKINTAHGPRDRRMRLSLDVARKFFGLQDVLGFDKASKTVEWLLKQSKMAIKQVTGEFSQINNGSGIFTLCRSTSDCEVVSGIDENSIPEAASTKAASPNSKRSKNKRIRRVRKPTFHPLSKESRKKARERARERTKDKKKQKELDDQHSTNLMTWSPIRTSKELAGTISHNSPPSVNEVEEMQNVCEQQIKSQEIGEESVAVCDPNLFIIPGNWSPSALFNYQQYSEISHQLEDFQFYGYHN